MKSFPLLLTSLIIVSSLEARENPFMPTKAYENEVARLMEIDQNDQIEFIDGNRMNANPKEIPSFYHGGTNSEQREDTTPIIKEHEKNMPHPMAVEKSEEQMIKEKKEQEEKMRKERMLQDALKKVEMVKKEAELAKQKAQKALEKAQELNDRGPQIYVKPRKTEALMDEKKEMHSMEQKSTHSMNTMMEKPDMKMMNHSKDMMMHTKTLEVLPFLKANYDTDMLTLDTPHKLIKKFYMVDEKKLIMDFRADVTFYTKRVDLESSNFKKLTAGNHKGKNFFRVVLEVEKDPAMYNVMVNNDMVNVSLKK